MAEVIRMPRMSDTMEEGNILVWHKKVGDTIKVGDVLAEVETDKATMDLESFYDGTLLYIGVASGIIAVNAILAVIGGKEEDYKAALSAEGAATTEAVAEKEAPVENSTSTTSSEPIVPSGAGSDAHVKASPLAKVIAKEAGLDIQKMTGSGDQGRIIKRDVEAALQSKPSPVVQQATPVKSAPLSIISDSGSAYEDKPLSQMRKAIARRLGESKFSAPHFYVTMAIDMTKAVSARTAMNAIAPSKLSFNDLVLKACAMALRKHPAINSSWTGDAIRQNIKLTKFFEIIFIDYLAMFYSPTQIIFSL